MRSHAGTAVVSVVFASELAGLGCMHARSFTNLKEVETLAGTWLMGAFYSQGCLVGFVHGEDHYKVHTQNTFAH